MKVLEWDDLKIGDYRLSKSVNNDGKKSNILDVPSSFRDIQKALEAAVTAKEAYEAPI